MKTWTVEEEARRLEERFKVVNQAEFARLHKVPGGPSMVSQHIKGRRPMSLAAATAYADGFNVPLAEISPRIALEVDAANKVASAAGDIANVIPAALGVHRVPLINYVQAGHWSEIAGGFHADEYLLTNLDLSDRAFALEINGESMLPEFRSGDRVIIDPAIPPSPGCFVVAKNGGDEATFKKYRLRGIGDNGEEIIELVPLNPDFAPMRSDKTPFRIVGKMVEHRRYYRNK